MKIVNVTILVGLGLLSGCSTVNSKFTCNKTAVDRCMSIEDVDRKTRFADDYESGSSSLTLGSQRGVDQKRTGEYRTSSDELVWIAPWKDKQGTVYSEQLIQGNQTKA